MTPEKVIAKLDEASKLRYYKFTYKGDGKCKICPQYDGQVFREDAMPQTHPNCKCAKITNNPVDIALGKFKPRHSYYVDGKDFNESRRQLEDKYGRIIDRSKFSAPGQELADNIKKKGMKRALYDHEILRERKGVTPYLDSVFIPTVGVGINMLEKRNIDRLQKMKVITEFQTQQLLQFRKLSEKEREKNQTTMNNALLGVKLSESQIVQLFEEDYQIAVRDAGKVIRKGLWVKKTLPDGNKYLSWEVDKVDCTTWDDTPDICIDMAFNLGGDGFTKYQKFRRAIQTRDYRRAAIELLQSRDYEDNIAGAGGRTSDSGLAKRRRDAAIELTKLAEEEEKKRRKQ